MAPVTCNCSTQGIEVANKQTDGKPLIHQDRVHGQTDIEGQELAGFFGSTGTILFSTSLLK